MGENKVDYLFASMDRLIWLKSSDIGDISEFWTSWKTETYTEISWIKW